MKKNKLIYVKIIVFPTRRTDVIFGRATGTDPYEFPNTRSFQDVRMKNMHRLRSVFHTMKIQYAHIESWPTEFVPPSIPDNCPHISIFDVTFWLEKDQS